MSMDTNTIHPHIAHTDDHQPSPNCRYAANGASTIRAPAGRALPRSTFGERGRGVVVEKRIETGQSQHDADRVEQGKDPRGRGIRQHRDVEHHSGGDTEVHRIGQRIDFRAHPGRRIQQPGDSAVEAIEDGGRGYQCQ